MKQFSKQLSWLLAFVLIFTSIVSTGIPVFASDDPIIIGEGTDEVIVAGRNVGLDYYVWGHVYITYYESADSNTVLYEQKTYNASDNMSTIGSNEIAIKPYAWHVTFVKKIQNNSGTAGADSYYFKAYPDTSLENVPVSTPTTMTLPEGTILTTGAAINVYVGNTPLTDYTASSPVTLPSVPTLCSYVGGETQFNSALESAGYHLPDLTELYYTVELTDKSTSPYSLKLTLVPTVEVTFNQNTGTPILDGTDRTKMYATPNATIDGTRLPAVSKDGVDFYGWNISGSDYYAYKANVTDTSYLKPGVNGASTLKAMYQEIKPTFKLDLTNEKVTNLLPNRTYAYPPYEDYPSYTSEIVADTNGEFSYETLESFESQAKLSLNSNDTGLFVNSDFVSLKHSIPNSPVTENTQTTATVTNTNDFAGCEFAIRATSDGSSLNWGTSSTFTGLTPQTEYKIFVRHKADENGFASDQAESLAFTTLAAKAVSNDVPNGVTIAAIPDQAHTGSAIEPTLVIKDGNKTLVQGTDYTVAYSNNINVGTATATVTFINSYSGTMTNNFNIGYLVSFNGNGGTGAMSNVSVIDGQQYTLPTCTFTAPANKAFKAWNVGGTEYAPGANCTITADTTVTAVWKDLIPAISPSGGGSTTPTYTAPTYTVMFNTDGGSAVESKNIKEGATIGEIPAPTKDGYVFDGWYLDKELTKPYDASAKITAATTLYAKWTKVETKPDDNSKNELVLTIGKKDAKAFGSDKALDSAPIIKNNRTMLPARFIAESLGAEVTWNGKKREVTIKGKNNKGEDVTILLYIDSDIAYVNGKKVKLDSPAFIENGRTFTPLRFVAEQLGANVEWIREEQKVVITKKDN